MQDNWVHKIFGGVFGFFGGCVKYTMLQMDPLLHESDWEKMKPSLVTAALSALTGFIVGDIYKLIKKKIKAFKKSKQ